VTLTDSGEPAKQTKETFQLVVSEEEEEEVKETPSNSQLIEQGAVTASLEDMTMMGELTIEFSTTVSIDNAGSFGSTMEIEVADRDGKDILNATLGIETTELNGAFLYCKITFADPKNISSYQTDKLRVRFLDSHRVSSSGNETNKLIPNWRTNYIDIPP